MDAETRERLLDELIVKERLHELEMAYCRGVDRRDPELLKSIFFEDAVEEHGEMYGGNAWDFADWVFRDFIGEFENTTHYVLNEWYKVDGLRAEGETHRVSYHRKRDPEPHEVIAGARTFNRYECRKGVWKIAYRGVVRDWITKRPVDDTLYKGHFEMLMSEMGPRDLSYDRMTMFGRGPI